MSAKLNPEQLEKLTQALMGTCMTVEEGLNQIDLNAEEFDAAEVEEQIDQIERCDTCGWWHEPYEMKDNGECESCNPDEDDES